MNIIISVRWYSVSKQWNVFQWNFWKIYWLLKSNVETSETISLAPYVSHIPLGFPFLPIFVIHYLKQKIYNYFKFQI